MSCVGDFIRDVASSTAIGDNDGPLEYPVERYNYELHVVLDQQAPVQSPIAKCRSNQSCSDKVHTKAREAEEGTDTRQNHEL